MATAVIADSPTPVRNRRANKLGTFQAKAFSSEKTEYHAVVRSSAFLRPTRSENQPPVTAPTNIPMKAAEVMIPMVATESFHCTRSAGAANAKLFRSPNSKNVGEGP